MSEDEANDDKRQVSDDEEGKDEELVQFVRELRADGKIPQTKSKPPRGHKNTEPAFQTGPKGVINDYKIAKQEATIAQEQKRIQTEKQIQKMALTIDKEDSTEEDAFFENDLEEEKLMAALRMQQLKEMQKMSSGERESIESQKILLKSRFKQFGTYTQLQHSTFVNFVDSEAPDTIVIIHLYQNYIVPCVRLNSILSRLVKKYPTYKFGKIISTEAKPGFEDVGLPSLLVYKNGEVLQSFVRVQDDLPEGYDVDDVEQFFIERGIFNSADASPDWEK